MGRNFWQYVFVFSAIIFLAMIFAAYLSGKARSQEIPQQHDLSDPDHWYDPGCCSLRDCAPARASVRAGPNGYEVVQLAELVPYGDPKIRRSKDDRYHVCERKTPHNNSRIICLYVPDRLG